MCSYLEGDYVGSEDGTVITSSVWQATQAEETEKYSEGMHCPIIRSNTFQLALSAVPWAWEHATTVFWERDLNAIHSLIAELYKGFAEGDPAPFIRASEIYFKEMERCFPGQTESGMKSRLAKDIASNAGRDNWVKPLDLVSMIIRFIRRSLNSMTSLHEITMLSLCETVNQNLLAHRILM